jgi:hypothetical protein
VAILNDHPSKFVLKKMYFIFTNVIFGQTERQRNNYYTQNVTSIKVSKTRKRKKKEERKRRMSNVTWWGSGENKNWDIKTKIKTKKPGVDHFVENPFVKNHNSWLKNKWLITSSKLPLAFFTCGVQNPKRATEVLWDERMDWGVIRC